ncbi:hypothetical protein [Actinomadura atramentaria]|uniref:hypothetical protein n=1 Tax=Actinomadura atramentaria TaxID=1990 RepID=UPI00039CBB0B|nr:hypothetical protein [Actinomadura atramentaria]
MRGDSIEVLAIGDGGRTEHFTLRAERIGRRVETVTHDGITEIREVNRNGLVLRSVEYPTAQVLRLVRYSHRNGTPTPIDIRPTNAEPNPADHAPAKMAAAVPIAAGRRAMKSVPTAHSPADSAPTRPRLMSLGPLMGTGWSPYRNTTVLTMDGTNVPLPRSDGEKPSRKRGASKNGPQADSGKPKRKRK